MQIRDLGICEYRGVWQKMCEFTSTRKPTSEDEIWLLQHHPVYTQGRRCHAMPLLDGRAVPVIHTDRGGLMTYHGPGQLVVYLLFDLKRRALGIKSLVHQCEQSVIALLQHYGIDGTRKPGAPGVYVGDKKIAALGFRITRGCCYHGVSVNIAMDLQPYDWIDTCGYPELRVTHIAEFLPRIGFQEVAATFQRQLVDKWDIPFSTNPTNNHKPQATTRIFA